MGAVARMTSHSRVRIAAAASALAGLMLAILVALGATADAGWLSRRLYGPQGAQASEGADAGSSAAFDTAGRTIRSLPGSARARALAVAATHEGHWRLANAAGETFTAATPDELARAFENLLPKDTGAPALYLAEHTAFAARDRLGELPKGAALHVVVAGTAYPVRRLGTSGRERLFALAKPKLAVELVERAVFDEILWQLGQPLARARMRQVALEPGGPASLAATPRLDPQTRKAVVDRLSPGALAAELGSVRGQTVLLSGRLDGDRLMFQPARGAEGAVSLADVFRAAGDGDTGVIVLSSNSGRQPVGRNWLWMRVELKGLEGALTTAGLGDFLSSLASAGDTLAVTGALAGRHIRMTARPLQAIESGSGRVGGVLTDLATRITGNVSIGGIEALLLAADRQGELSLRLLPGIPSDWQIGYLALLTIGLAGARISWRWWSAWWPAEHSDEYASWAGAIAADVVRGLVYAVLFMPLAAIPAALAMLLGLGRPRRRRLR